MPRTRPKPSAAPPTVAIVLSRYNASITDRLLDGALAEYERRGGDRGRAVVLEAPGAYELPAIALAAARSGRFQGIAALGCLIKGETRHDQYIAGAVAHGLVGVTLATGIPVAFGVLTVDTPEQAHARAGGPEGNKGADAMAAVLDTLAVTATLAAPARHAAGARARLNGNPRDKAARRRRP